MKKNFGKELREARKKAGKTMLDLADYLGVSVVFISDVERGNRAPLRTDRILRAAQFLNADAKMLLQAAAEQRGAFELDAEVSNRAREVGAALMRGWKDLDEKQLEQIAKILK